MYRHFKKVSSDENCTTLRHSDGHQLKIAHAKLSPKMRTELEQLPSHEEKSYAKGGDVKYFAEGDDVQADQTKPQAPVTINIGGGQPQGQMPVHGNAPNGTPNALMPPSDQQAQVAPPAPEAPSLASKPQEAQPDQTQAPAPAANPADSAPAQDDQQIQPQAGTMAPPMQDDTHQAVAQHLNQEAQRTEQDIAQGHITPETYKSLFAKKDTLGTISSIFGLMLSGIGSGLTGQPNAALQMMENTINRDLDAQKTSSTNAQNWLRINQSGELNKQTIANMVKTGQLTEQQAKVASAQADQIHLANSQNQMLFSSFDNLVKETDKMPEGPEKQKRKDALGYLYSKIGEKISNVNSAAAGAAAFMDTVPSSGDNEQDFAKKSGKLRMMGPEGEKRANLMDARHISGVPEVAGQMATRDVPEESRNRVLAMQTLSDKGKDLLNFAKQHKGSLDPKTLAVGAQKAEEMINFYNDSVSGGGALTKDRLAWYDKQINKNPASIFQDVLGNNAKLDEIVKSNDNRKSLLLKSLGYNPKAGPTYKKVDGGWQKVK